MKLGEYIFRDLEKNPYLLTLYTNLLKKYASVQFKIYDEIKIENTQWSQHSQVIFTMTFVKKKRNIYDFIFSGNVSAECTEETYALVKSWLPESVRMPKVKF